VVMTQKSMTMIGGTVTATTTTNPRALVVFGTLYLGGNPNITGEILLNNATDSSISVTGSGTTFAPSPITKKYAFTYASSSPPAATLVAVTGGATFADNFELTGYSNRKLTASSGNLVIATNP